MKNKIKYIDYVKRYIEDYKDSTGKTLTIKEVKKQFSKIEYKEAEKQRINLKEK